jgi:hypothetical protein
MDLLDLLSSNQSDSTSFSVAFKTLKQGCPEGTPCTTIASSTNLRYKTALGDHKSYIKSQEVESLSVLGVCRVATTN